MNAIILVVPPGTSGMDSSTGYIIGMIIALVILGYLFYSMIKPDKF